MSKKTQCFVRILYETNNPICVSSGPTSFDEHININDARTRHQINPNIGNQLSRMLPNSIE